MAAHKENEQEVAKAKSLYLDYTPFTEILELADVSRDQLKYYIRKYWREERERFKSELFDDFTSNKKASLLKLGRSTLQVLERGMTHLAKRETPPTPQEARSAAAVFEAMDKILKLDEGKATDIIETTQPADVVELKKRLRKDPMLEIEDAYEILDGPFEGHGEVDQKKD
jgi:hypothetical protein